MTIRQRRNQAFSLIEILVVLVILLVGVLSVIRIFPLGLIGLSNTRDFTMANTIARRQIDALASKADDLPQEILAVKYVYVQNGGTYNLVLQADPNSSPRDLSNGAGQLLSDGNVFISDPGGGPGTLIPWRYYNDANRTRRIIGEGGSIPAARPVGTEFGGLKLLSFAPIVNDPNLLLIYSAEMDGNPVSGYGMSQAIPNPRPWTFDNDDGIPQVWLSGVTGRRVSYKLNFSYWANNSGVYQRVDVIDQRVVVTESPMGPSERKFDTMTGEVYPFELKQLIGNPANWVELVEGSVTVNRLFDPIPVGNAFDPIYPYEYKVLNGNLGAVLFNPAGYNYRERRGRTTRPLTAQINYDVYNWHIFGDEIRADLIGPMIHKLTLQRLKATGDFLNDKRRYPGLEIPVQAGGGTFDNMRDVIVVDLDTGGVVSPLFDPQNPTKGRSYKIDYLRGIIAFSRQIQNPPNNPGANEFSGRGISIVLPDANMTVLTPINAAGRNFKVFYQAHNDWAVQVFKAPQRISISLGTPLSIAQCYVGGTPGGPGGLPTRVYFPLCDVGSKVNIREIWYRERNTNILKVLRDQDFLIRASSGDPTLLPYIDIKEADQNADRFDFGTYGYAVRGVSGTSLRARVIWNTADKEDVPGDTATDIQQRTDLHEAWTRQWRHVEVQSYLTRRDRN